MSNDIRIKLMHVVGSLPIGGAEFLLASICKKIDKKKYDVYVCSITDEGVIGSNIREAGAHLITLGSSLRVYSPQTIWSLFKLMKQIKPLIVQTHIYPSNTLGRIAAFFANVPIIIATEHGFYRFKKRRQIFIDWLLSHITDKIIVISNAVKHYLAKRTKIPYHKFEVVYNFINPDIFSSVRNRNITRSELGLTDADFVIGSVGRIVKQKGYDILLDAAGILREKGRAFKIIIAGDGPYLDHLKTRAQKNQVQDHTIFLGFRLDIADILNVMDVFVLPTLDEGFGISIVEAQYLGLPVIASDIDAIPEIIQNGLNGLLVPPGDHQALANAVDRIMGNCSLGFRIGRAGRDKVNECFVADVGISRLENIYTTLINEKRK